LPAVFFNGQCHFLKGWQFKEILKELDKLNSQAANVTASKINYTGSTTVSPFTRSKYFRLNGATSLPRSDAVAATMMS
jgi:hypothetical protein